MSAFQPVILGLCTLLFLGACEPYAGARTNCWTAGDGVDVTRAGCQFLDEFDAVAFRQIK